MYHVVFITKQKQIMIFETIRKHLREIFHELSKRQGVVIGKERLMKNHVYMCLSVSKK
jgi:putative transposase